jgi:DNA-binding MarR family transcriptional regulator
MLKALERKRWVRRVRSTADVRAKNVEITAAGLAVLRRALPAMIAVQRGVFGDEGAPGGSLLDALLSLE